MKKKTPYDQGMADCWAERDRCDWWACHWDAEQMAEYHKGWKAQEVLGDYWRDKNQDLNHYEEDSEE